MTSRKFWCNNDLPNKDDLKSDNFNCHRVFRHEHFETWNATRQQFLNGDRNQHEKESLAYSTVL